MSRRCPTCGTSFPDETFFCGHDGTVTVQEQNAGDVDARLGTKLGDYVVVARVADGAMGRVYEGRHPDTKARVAIKVLHLEVAEDPVSVERFRREYETAEQLNHPNIVKVLEFGEAEGGSFFMTMEYLQGEELSKRLRRGGGQSPANIVRIASQAVSALDHAHSFGFVHRDLKPDNIFLCESSEGDVVKILDFGSVKLQMEMGPKLTAFGTTLGSPYYMSPEQAMGKQDVDQRTDVFAVAAIVYEMATGKVAFEGGNIAEILMKIMQETPPPIRGMRPDLPSSLDEVVSKGLRKEKEGRFRTAGELGTELLRAFGLTSSIEEYAKTPVHVIEEKIKHAVPASPKPAQVVAPSAPISAPTRNTFDESEIPKTTSSSSLPPWLWPAVAGACGLLAIVAYLLSR